MEINVSKWERILDNLSDVALDVALRILMAIIIYIVGRFLIRRVIKGINKMRSFRSIDATAENYIITFIKAVLYVVLAVSIVAVLGVPMSSVITVIASAGVAIGLALQGALSNVAGGLMLLIFRPFSVGDYIKTSGHEGYVRSIKLVYTDLVTFDKRVVSLPNGSLMNSVIVNTTSEARRRVDLVFEASSDEPVPKVQDVMLSAVREYSEALTDPAPVAVVTGTVKGGLEYTVRVWAETKDYWTVYEGLMKDIPMAMNAAGIARPAAPVRVQEQ